MTSMYRFVRCSIRPELLSGAKAGGFVADAIAGAGVLAGSVLAMVLAAGGSAGRSRVPAVGGCIRGDTVVEG